MKPLTFVAIVTLVWLFWLAVRPLDPDAFSREYESSDYQSGYVGVEVYVSGQSDDE